MRYYWEVTKYCCKKEKQMKITDVKTTLIHCPDAFIFQDSTVFAPPPGAKGRDSLFIHIQTDEGIEGFAPGGGGTAAYPTRAVIEKELKKALVGQDPFNIEYLWNRMFWLVRGYGRKGVAFYAISAIDIALWDLKAKALGLPLYRLLGQYTDIVPIYGSGGWTNLSDDELVEEMTGYIDRGIPRVKMKVAKNFGSEEEEDINRLEIVRDAVGDEVEMFVDANNGYYAKQAIEMSRYFEEYGVRWFEEPVLADDIEGLIKVSQAIDMPVATGEHEYTKYGFKELLTRGAVDIVQPDVGRVGGITEWLKVAHMAHAFNLPVAPHGAQLVHLHLACATPNLKLVEYLGVVEKMDRFFYTSFPEPLNGMWSPYADRPGLGLELDPAVVKKYTV